MSGAPREGKASMRLTTFSIGVTSGVGTAEAAPTTVASAADKAPRQLHRHRTCLRLDLLDLLERLHPHALHGDAGESRRQKRAALRELVERPPRQLAVVG